jgi:TPP-dependent 2-oxoacid decarboxylase
MMDTTETCTVSSFLLRRLKELGCDHIFGVPGDFVLEFLCRVLTSGIEYVGRQSNLNYLYILSFYRNV